MRRHLEMNHAFRIDFNKHSNSCVTLLIWYVAQSAVRDIIDPEAAEVQRMSSLTRRLINAW